MSDIALRTEDLSKVYWLGDGVAYGTLRDRISESVRNPFGRSETASLQKTDCKRAVWALRSISLEIKTGQVVGIIGHNGAGKSTLLKVLARITPPTRGFAEVHGSLGSLLEIGTGFHPELTGRENIFLNGAIMGMSRVEIRQKFDQIVSFAGIEKFIDTPVKRYSSGMYVRLAFSVAAHLESEILLVDEVLAVGDAAFQKKCLQQLECSAQDGRTVLFVSHNLGTISALCDRSILLEHGRVKHMGDTATVLSSYLESINSGTSGNLRQRKDRQGSGAALLTSIQLKGPSGDALEQILSGSECRVELHYESSRPLNRPRFRFTIYSSLGQPLVHFDSAISDSGLSNLPTSGTVTCQLGPLALSQGSYRINVALEEDDQLLDHITGAHSFVVEAGNFFGTGKNVEGLKDVCLMQHQWEHCPAP